MAVTTMFSMVRDINGYNGFGLQPATDMWGVSLIQNTDTTITVPYSTNSNIAQYMLAIFSIDPGLRVSVAYNQTAVSPSSGSFAAISSELNPIARMLLPGTVIHCITPDASAYVGITFYAV